MYTEGMGQRLQVYLSERGVTSRRGAAEWVRAGRVKVNGEVVSEPGLRVEAGRDRVEVDGVDVGGDAGRRRTLVLYKPRGYVCTRSDREGRSVYDLLEGVSERLNTAGRLDVDSEGLLVVTNDGDLLQRLTHPRHGHEKVYRVTVSGAAGPETVARLCALRELGAEPIAPVAVKRLRDSDRPGRSVLEFRLREGRNRQVRRMCEAVGLPVHRLLRVGFGGLALGGLGPGQWRTIEDAELRALGWLS